VEVQKTAIPGRADIFRKIDFQWVRHGWPMVLTRHYWNLLVKAGGAWTALPLSSVTKKTRNLGDCSSIEAAIKQCALTVQFAVCAS
jgi:hypothetical protein